MPGKMRAALKINFSRDVMKIRRRSSGKKTWTFLEKIMLYYFYVSTNCRPFEEGPRGKSPMISIPFSLMQPCWDLQVTLCSNIL